MNDRSHDATSRPGIRAALGALILAGLAAPAIAADLVAETEGPNHFLEGVYSDEPDCASGYQPSSDHAYLTSEGFASLDYGCDFVGFETVEGVEGFVAAADCSWPEAEIHEQVRVVNTSLYSGPANVVTVEYSRAPEPTKFYQCPSENTDRLELLAPGPNP